MLRRVDRPGGSAILTQLSPHSHLPYLWLRRGNFGKPTALTQVIPVHPPHGCLSSLPSSFTVSHIGERMHLVIPSQGKQGN